MAGYERGISTSVTLPVASLPHLPGQDDTTELVEVAAWRSDHRRVARRRNTHRVSIGGPKPALE
jgi:hypothetical protein